jgi:hypothetical protein
MSLHLDRKVICALAIIGLRAEECAMDLQPLMNAPHGGVRRRAGLNA